MEARAKKQLIIGAIFVLLIGGAVYGLADRFFIIEATCFDNIQNGKEEGVDCGTLACGIVCQEPVQPLQVSDEKLFRIGPGSYDFVAKLVNSNTSYGAPEIMYSIALPGEGTKTGMTYILPGQTKYVVLTSLRTAGEVGSAGLRVNSVQWEKLDMPSGEVNLINRRGNFGNAEAESSYEGVVFNDSNYDFDKVEVSVILFDASNAVIGVNRTEIRTLLAKTERSFKVVWPFPQPLVSRADVQISTNLFENSNFIKSYGTQERFQEFY
ncbi:MAG: hypothetical protein HYT67_00025 [Candidatus Yanofskybacteria bacterium]|nr:hypothetical protein [Candidatus Yanofskybacteria bacterium]